jgi:hypothetical protein
MKAPLFPTICFSMLLLGSMCNERQHPVLPEIDRPVDTIKPFVASGDVLLNEICTSNSGLITDEDGDDPDWIELYNKGDSAINLNGYSLSDDSANYALWTFDSTFLAPKSYLVVFASGKNRPTIPASPANDTLGIKAFESWSDISNGGHSTIVAFGAKTIQSYDSSGHWQIGATFNQVDNRPDLDWSSVNMGILFKRQQTGYKTDYSMYSTLHLTMTIPEGKKLAIRFILRSLPAWKGPLHTITGTGKPDDQYSIPLNQGEGGLDLLQMNGIRIESVQYDFGSVSFILRNMILSAPTGKLHAGFKLSGEENGCYLSNASGKLCDRVDLSPLPENISKGRSGTSWRIFTNATPGAPNDTISFSGLTDPPVISNKGGFFDAPVKVTLAAPDSAAVYYTLDGAVPGSATGTKYTGPVTISTTCVLRCVALRDGAAVSSVVTESYFINETVRLPVISLSTDSAALFNPDTGLYMKGPNAQDTFPYFGANFWSDKEVPVYCEMFEPAGKRVFSTGAGLSIAGNWSRGMAKKSLQISFREQYGAGELKAAPFPAYPELKKFEKLILRNNGGSSSDAIINNSMMMSLIADRGIDFQKNRPVVVYINGRYFGIHILMEPSNHDYVYSEYGLTKDEIDFYDYGDAIKWGTPANWNRLLGLLQSSAGKTCEDTIGDSAFTLINNELDVANFIDYNAFQIFIGNTDWPANNNRRWRSLAPDGRWRWLIYDLDAGFGGFGIPEGAELVSYNTLAFALDGTQPADNFPNGSAFTYPLRALLCSPAFREDFINRFATLLATNFSPARVEARVDSMAALIRDEVPADFKRWDYKIDWWQTAVDDLKRYGRERAPYMYRFIGSQFGLDSTFTLTMTVRPGTVKINGMVIRESSFTGTYFSAVPVTLSAKDPSGRLLKDWGDGNRDNPRRLRGSSGTIALNPVFE